jgi:hypothetical protein
MWFPYLGVCDHNSILPAGCEKDPMSLNSYHNPMRTLVSNARKC